MKRFLTERSREAARQSAAEFREALAAWSDLPEVRREVVDRAATSAAEAVPAARGLDVDVQARGLVIVERASDLPIERDGDAGKSSQVCGRLESEQRISDGISAPLHRSQVGTARARNPRHHPRYVFQAVERISLARTAAQHTHGGRSVLGVIQRGRAEDARRINAGAVAPERVDEKAVRSLDVADRPRLAEQPVGVPVARSAGRDDDVA